MSCCSTERDEPRAVAVDFYFDFISPYSYLAATQLPDFERRHGARVRWRPVNLPKLLRLSGNIPPASVRNKAVYLLRDLKRQAAHLRVPLRVIVPGSLDARPALRIAAALDGEDRVRFCRGVFEGLYATPEIDPKAPDWLDRIFVRMRFPAAWRNLDDGSLAQRTEEAVRAGLFGVPTFILRRAAGRPEMFFGLDHMDALARACEEERAGA